jgi:hypothetical protein
MIGLILSALAVGYVVFNCQYPDSYSRNRKGQFTKKITWLSDITGGTK